MHSYLFAALLCSLSFAGGQDVVGCGGFVRSKFPVDFTKIEMMLLTKSGILKYRTDCAPNNGYFLIPLYDKGEFILRVEPPSGWMFKPSEVALKVDGKTDPCSRGEDIDFELLGFSIYGQVISQGLEEGPREVAVALKSEDGSSRETSTGPLGRYSFEGVVPGTYSLSASHPLWDVRKEPVEVRVEEDSVEAPRELVVLGFDVTGHVFSKEEGVGGVQFLLYPEGDIKVGCSGVAVPDGPREVRPSCVAVSDKEGQFSFSSLPPAKYTLVPHYREGQIVFEVQPTEVHFTVYNDSMVVKPDFEVQGFSVSGKVLIGKQGEGVEGAKVYVNGKPSTKTDNTGTYQLFNVTTGRYKIQVEAAKLHFEPLDIQISPATPYLPNIIPTTYSVCGEVSIPIPPMKSITSSFREIQVFTSNGELKTTPTTDQKGKFCAMLPPGEYKMKPVVTMEESLQGLLLQPSELPVRVEETPISTGLTFSQFTATLTGNINCIERCSSMDVILKRTGKEGQQLTTQIEPKGAEGTMQFSNVLPGEVIVSLQYPSWCWETESVTVEITPERPSSVQFTQTGFTLECTVTHDIKMIYFTGNDSKTQVELKSGHNKICLEKPGIYTLKPQSCHKFEANHYTFDVAAPSPVVMRAMAHNVSVSVFSPKKTTDVALRIRSLRIGAAEQMLTSDEITQLHGDSGTLHAYHFTFIAYPSDELEVTPLSSELMFVPQQRKYTVSADCPEHISPFEGSPGIIISGHIEPPLHGVAIVITVEEEELINVNTDELGEYRAGPIHGGKQHVVQAQLEGYVLEPLPHDPYSFKALKHSQIRMQVLEEDGNALTNVLVSLSGANFRSNNLTGQEGTLVYHNLAPGQYYLKPLLREYEFSPVSKVIGLQQGHSEEVIFTGRRVAFSCSGRVTSLNGQPEEGVQVEGVLVEDVGDSGSSCESYSDESTTDEDGTYHLRGLMPGCQYFASVGANEEDDIERSVPTRRKVLINDSDVRGVDFIIFHSVTTVFTTGNVITEENFLETLKVDVYKEGKTLYSVGVDSAGFFALPALPVDMEHHYQLIVDSSLSTHLYKFTKVETTFVADRDRHITLRFTAKERHLEHEATRGSFIHIIVAVLIIFAIANFEKILILTEGLLQSNKGSSQESSTAGEGKRKIGRRR